MISRNPILFIVCFLSFILFDCQRTTNLPIVIPCKQTEMIPKPSIHYILTPPDLYITTGPGPAGSSNSQAWKIANEFIYRTSLRHQFKLPSSNSRLGIVEFVSKESNEILKVYVNIQDQTVFIQK